MSFGSNVQSRNDIRSADRRSFLTASCSQTQLGRALGRFLESLRAISGTLRRDELRNRANTVPPERFRYSDLKGAVWNSTAMYFQ